MLFNTKKELKTIISILVSSDRGLDFPTCFIPPAVHCYCTLLNLLFI